MKNKVTYLSSSLLASLAASEEHHTSVSLSKREDGTHAVIKRVFPNHRTKKFAFGYKRFGQAVVWVENKVKLTPTVGYATTADQEPLDAYLVRHFSEAAFKAADAVTAARKAVATTLLSHTPS